MKQAEQLRSQGNEELQAQYLQLCEEIFELENERRVHRKLEKSHLMKEKKKQRARILTIMNEKGQG